MARRYASLASSFRFNLREQRRAHKCYRITTRSSFSRFPVHYDCIFGAPEFVVTDSHVVEGLRINFPGMWRNPSIFLNGFQVIRFRVSSITTFDGLTRIRWTVLACCEADLTASPGGLQRVCSLVSLLFSFLSSSGIGANGDQLKNQESASFPFLPRLTNLAALTPTAHL